MKLKQSKRAIIATLVGNVMEFYDFIVFAFMSVYISDLFFANAPDNVKLLYTFAIFASGYLTRPLGALFFGHIGDRHGRKISLYYSILLATVSTILIGVLPTYEMVGLGAPVLLIICRLLQGFAVSGEEGGAAVYLYEMLDKGKAGLGGSMVLGSAYLGVLLGSSVCLLVSHMFSKDEIYLYAWRTPFFVSLLLGILTLLLRRGMHESREFSSDRLKRNSPIKELISEHKMKLALHILVVASLAIPVYVFTIFVPTYLINYVNISPQISQSISVLSLLVLGCGVPIFGIISDKVGHIKTFVAGCVINIFLSYPAFVYISSGNYLNIFLGIFMLSLPLFAVAAPLFAMLINQYPLQLRFTGVSVVFNTSMSIFGGTIPATCIYFISSTNSLNAPGLVVMFSGAIGIMSLYFYHKHIYRTKTINVGAEYDFEKG